MACETPLHLERVLLEDGGHVVDLTVTRRTTDSLCYVNAVIEVSELRQVMNTFPFDRFVLAETRADRFEIRRVRPKLTVTVHTSLRRRQTGGSGCLDSRVTVTTIDAVITDVMLVTELYRLLSLKIATGQVRRSGDLRIDVKRRPRKNNAEDHAYPGDVVCTLMKKLRH